MRGAWRGLFFFALLALFSSCTEDDSLEVEEYVDWQAKNEQYQKELFDKHASGTTGYRVIKSVYRSESEEMTPWNSIVARVMESGSGTETPLYTDSVRVIYEGRLLPSTSYAEGKVFDRSFAEDINFETAKTTSIPAKFCVSNLTEGFATALQNMHVGDAWTVAVPQQLAYGASATGDIPAYSTLIFRIRLMGIYHPGNRVPDWK